MKRNLPSIVTGITLVVILGLYMTTYQVRFTETAVLKTFGEAQQDAVKKEPGLYPKWPWPIQEVKVYDKRTRILETHTEQTATHDKKPVILASFTGWHIEDPYVFLTSLGGRVETAERQLRDIIETHQKEVIGDYEFSQLVSKDSDRLKFDEIETAIGQRVGKAVQDYGIVIDTVGIKRLALPQDVTESVFESMRAERRALAQRYESEGRSESDDIVARAQSDADIIMAFAEARAQEYRAEGNARAAEYYEVLQQEPKLSLFLDRLNKLKETLRDRTTVVLSWDQYPFTEFKHEGRLDVEPPAEPDAAVISPLPGGQVPTP